MHDSIILPCITKGQATHAKISTTNSEANHTSLQHQAKSQKMQQQQPKTKDHQQHNQLETQQHPQQTEVSLTKKCRSQSEQQHPQITHLRINLGKKSKTRKEQNLRHNQLGTRQHPQQTESLCVKSRAKKNDGHGLHICLQTPHIQSRLHQRKTTTQQQRHTTQHQISKREVRYLTSLWTCSPSHPLTQDACHSAYTKNEIRNNTTTTEQMTTTQEQAPPKTYTAPHHHQTTPHAPANNNPGVRKINAPTNTAPTQRYETRPPHAPNSSNSMARKKAAPASTDPRHPCDTRPRHLKRELTSPGQTKFHKSAPAHHNKATETLRRSKPRLNRDKNLLSIKHQQETSKETHHTGKGSAKTQDHRLTAPRRSTVRSTRDKNLSLYYKQPGTQCMRKDQRRNIPIALYRGGITTQTPTQRLSTYIDSPRSPTSNTANLEEAQNAPVPTNSETGVHLHRRSQQSSQPELQPMPPTSINNVRRLHNPAIPAPPKERLSTLTPAPREVFTNTYIG